MALFDDLVSPAGGSYFYDLVEPPGAAAGAGATATTSASGATVATGSAGSASGAGVSDAATAAGGAALGHAVVTIVLPVYNGIGSIFYGYGESWGNFQGTPANGDTVRHPTTGGFRILPDGTIEAGAHGTYACYYNDGGGEDAFTVVVDGSIQVFPGGTTATAIAPGASLYGGVNVEGAGAQVTPTPSTGTVTTGNIAPGQGATAQAIPSTGTAATGAQALGGGATADAVPAEAVAETVTTAAGAGAQATAVPAQGAGSGDVIASGGGVTAQASAAIARGQGDLIVGQIPFAVLTIVYPSQLPFAQAA